MHSQQTKKAKLFIQKENKPILVLMTRWHSIYRCKSRLSKEIGALNALSLDLKIEAYMQMRFLKFQSDP